MEVLSCPEIQYAGESNCPQQSSGSKSPDCNLEQEASSVIVDCLQERSRNDGLIGRLEKAHCPSEVNCLSNQNNLQECNILKTSGLENVKDIYGLKDSLQNISSPQEILENLLPSANQESIHNPLAVEFLHSEKSLCTDDCQKFTPFKMCASRPEESNKQTNGQLQNLPVGSECRDSLILDRLNDVNGYTKNVKETQRSNRNDSEPEKNIFAVNHVVANCKASLCDGAAVSFSLQDQIVNSSCKDSGLPIKNVEDREKTTSEEGYHIEAQSTERDGPEALWVKWRGMWQTGIRCSRVDYPLSTLKAKPTNEGKKYFVVFFPNTRTYSWVDMQLVLSIDLLPEPLAYGTHFSWMAFVKDLTFPRRYIMQKLAVSMLDISDQLHTEAMIESARDASTWKEFAKEASLCRDYTELGKMLLKLHNMILPDYISSTWLEHSFDTWMQQCLNAQSAEVIETLIEELVNSVLWSNVEELWEATVQPQLGLEWKTWKQEVMKLFSTSHPGVSGMFDKQSYEGHLNSGQYFSRKRPKLDVRSEVDDKMIHDNNINCGPRNVNSQGMGKDTVVCASFNAEVTNMGAPVFSGDNIYQQDDVAVKVVTPICNLPSAISASGDIVSKRDLSMDYRDRDSPKYRRCLAFMEAKGRQCGRWANDGDVFCCVHLGNHSVNRPFQAERTQSTSMPQSTWMATSNRLVLSEHRDKDSPYKYQQCAAFVEAKGRQCGRWANDGDIYCCVHLSNHSSKSSLLELTPVLDTVMCEGTTVHGKKCKHRARPGSVYCKKHEFHRTGNLAVAGNFLTYLGVNEKMNQMETIPIAASSVCYDGGLTTGKSASFMQDKLISDPAVGTPGERNLHKNNLELSSDVSATAQNTTDLPCCIGFDLNEQCLEKASKHNLYCEKHVPNFLKHPRNGESRFISEEIFINLLKFCTSRKEKIRLHQACELLCGSMKDRLSHQKLVSRGDLMSHLLPGACEDEDVGKYLLKLVSSEREKTDGVWGLEELKDTQNYSLEMSALVPAPKIQGQNPISPNGAVKCKICMAGFADDETLSIHWMEVHKKEAQWLFRGYACSVCMTSFTNKKVQDAHVKEKHGVHFLEGSLLFRCMACNSHFNNPNELWQHVLSSHSMEFRLPVTDNLPKNSGVLKNESCLSNDTSEKDDDHPRFVCRFCGLKFDLLPDLGRHHQSAHRNMSYASHLPLRTKKHLRHSRLRHSRFKKALGVTSRFKKSSNFGMKCFRSSNSVASSRMGLHTQASQNSCLGRLLESHCLNVAETILDEVMQTKTRPCNMEIIYIARTACCRTHLLNVLQEKYGTLPENIYLRAVKLCSEQNIQVHWHLDGFICPNGCKCNSLQHSLSSSAPTQGDFTEPAVSSLDHVIVNDGASEMVESHCVLNPEHFNWSSIRRAVTLCEDMSFGHEPVPVPCVIDENIMGLVHADLSEASTDQNPGVLVPWQGFTYVTRRLLDPSLGLDPKSSQLGCACSDVRCHPETCDHVYLFDNDYEDAKDVQGKSMRGRFPYDERGRIIIEQGCLVYECNSLCSCDKNCQNRVLQKGVHVKLEVFRTEKKGWAVRAAEAIPCGTFVCEYIGEVVNDAEANQRVERNSEGCSYLYYIDARIDDEDGDLGEGKVSYVIDATKYGNIARFINHSCSPNLVNYQVLVENMDCQLAHVGFYTIRDIAASEELAYDYRYNLRPRNGCPCYCGSSNCRGRLH